MQDIIENYNDYSQELTEEQLLAVQIRNRIHVAEILKERQDRGEQLDAIDLWVLDEFYKYDERQ